jgi:hypothetical protein
MNEDVISPPSLLFKRVNRSGNMKRQRVADLIASCAAGLTRQEVAAAIGSPPHSVSVMIHRINKEWADQGWKIDFIKLKKQPGRRGAPERRYRLVRLSPPKSE